MSIREIVGMLGAAAGFLLAAWVIPAYRLWSLPNCWAVPWLCSALAAGLLVVTAVCALTGCSPASVPQSRVVAAVAGVAGALAVGLVVNGFYVHWQLDLTSNLAEWAGFTIILIVLFWLPRHGKSA